MCFDFLLMQWRGPLGPKRYNVPDYCFSGLKSKTPNNTNKDKIKNLSQHTNKSTETGQKGTKIEIILLALALKQQWIKKYIKF